MGFVDVFNNDNLELPWQKYDRQPGEQDHRRPRSGATGIQLEQSSQFRAVGSTLENIGKTAEHAVGNKQADRHEGNQLDHRLESHRRHHALVTLGRIKMARSEQNGEQRQDGSDKQRRIEPPRQDALVGVREKHPQAGRDRLQLERDIGHNPDHRNHRHQAGKQLTLAVARSNEIGNRRNALGLADTDHLHNDADEQQHQCRTKINGQKR